MFSSFRTLALLPVLALILYIGSLSAAESLVLTPFPVASSYVESDAAFPFPVGRSAAVYLPHVTVGGGSGTAIAGAPAGKTWILTNRHVLEAGYGDSVTADGREYAAREVARSQTADLAILVVDAELPTVVVAESNPPAGIEVTSRGMYRGLGFLKRGRLIGHVTDVSVGCDFGGGPGDSGSGLIAEGKLYGVMHGIGVRPEMRGTAFVVPVTDVRKLVDQLGGANVTITADCPNGVCPVGTRGVTVVQGGCGSAAGGCGVSYSGVTYVQGGGYGVRTVTYSQSQGVGQRTGPIRQFFQNRRAGGCSGGCG